LKAEKQFFFLSTQTWHNTPPSWHDLKFKTKTFATGKFVARMTSNRGTIAGRDDDHGTTIMIVARLCPKTMIAACLLASWHVTGKFQTFFNRYKSHRGMISLKRGTISGFYIYNPRILFIPVLPKLCQNFS